MRLATHQRRWIAHILVICAILLGALGIAAAPVSASDGPCDVGYYSGGQYLICVPPVGWNGDLVVYAHGYVAPENPLVVPEDQLVLPDGTSIPETIMGLGYAFAATSYRTNGLAIADGATDLVGLVTLFESEVDPAGRVYLVGASEGGLNTALTVEQAPDVFDGGVAACGPVGDFRRQVDYWGDVRVLFDYFFPGVLPPFTPEEPLVPPELIQNWYWCGDPARNENYPCTPNPAMAYELLVRQALATHPHQTQQLLEVANVPVNTSDPAANIDALVQLLWYNVFAVDDAVEKLGGQPFDNRRRWYSGSDDDWELNAAVVRFRADREALNAIRRHYETSGDLDAPLITLHTTGDPTVPYWHEPLYRRKVWRNHSWWEHTNLPILRYGHCNFEVEEVLFAFSLLRFQVEGFGLMSVGEVLTSDQYDNYQRMTERYEVAPALEESGVSR